MYSKTIHYVLVIMWMYRQACSKHPWRSSIQKKGRGKTSTTVLKASCQKHRSWQLYSNEGNGLQQFQMESCQPIKRLKDKKKRKKKKIKLYLIHINMYIKWFHFSMSFSWLVQSSCTEKALELACFICLHLPIWCIYKLWMQN